MHFLAADAFRYITGRISPADEAVLAAARRLQILPADGGGSAMSALLRLARSGDARARELLGERARV